MLPRKNYLRHVYGYSRPTVTNKPSKKARMLKQDKLAIPDSRLKSVLDQCPKV